MALHCSLWLLMLPPWLIIMKNIFYFAAAIWLSCGKFLQNASGTISTNCWSELCIWHDGWPGQDLVQLQTKSSQNWRKLSILMVFCPKKMMVDCWHKSLSLTATTRFKPCFVHVKGQPHGSAWTTVNAQYVVHFTSFAPLPMPNDVYGWPSSMTYQQPVPTMTTYQVLSSAWIDWIAIIQKIYFLALQHPIMQTLLPKGALDQCKVPSSRGWGGYLPPVAAPCITSISSPMNGPTAAILLWWRLWWWQQLRPCAQPNSPSPPHPPTCSSKTWP